MKNFGKAVFFFQSLVCVLFSVPAFAANDNVTQDTQTRLISEAEKVRQKEALPPKKVPAQPQIEVAEQKQPVEAPDQGQRFLVAHIILEGNTVFGDKQLRPLVAPYENRQLNITEIKEVAKGITAYYRSHGYITSRAYLPPQTVENNTVRLALLEGKIGEIIVEGNKFFLAKTYRDSLNLQPGRVLQSQDLEKRLLYLNQILDQNIKAYIAPGNELSTSDIVIKVVENFPVHFSYEFNNHGTKLTHRARHIMNVTNDNFLGMGDKLSTTVIVAEQAALDGVALHYQVPLRRTRTTLSLDYSYFRSQLTQHLRVFHVIGRSQSFIPQISQLLYWSPALSLASHLAFEFKNSETKIAGDRANDDKVRMIRPGLEASANDAWGKTFVNFDTHIGIPKVMGGMKERDANASRAGTGGRFFYYTADLTRLERLPYSSVFIQKLGVQFTHHPLPSIEQYRLGGSDSVRGYPEVDSFGDYGFNFSSEVDTPAWIFPKNLKFPYTNIKCRDAVQFAAFLDGGKTYQRDRANPTDEKDRLLLGAGWGFRVRLRDNVQVHFDMGFPFGDDSTDKGRTQIHLSSDVRF